MSHAPVIGLTTYGRNETDHFTLPASYGDAIQAAGGVPILLTPNQSYPNRILDILDGVIFTGGGDIDPAAYDGDHHPTVYSVDPERDRFELALAAQVLHSRLPTLVI